MPDIIQSQFAGSQIMLLWYAWGVIVSFLAALGVTVFLVADSQRTGQDATIWKSLAAVASVLAIPALLARVHSGFAFEMQSSLALVAYFSIFGLLLAIAAAVGYFAASRQTASTCPICGQPLQPGWTQCPYHAAPQPVSVSPQPASVVQAVDEGQVPITPITDVTPPTEPMSAFSPGSRLGGLGSDIDREGNGGMKETRAMGQGGRPMQRGFDSPPTHKGTVILRRSEPPKALAFLVIASGPYKNTTLPLGDGVTKIGRNGVTNDHAIDDDAVSDQHLSIRYQNGTFTATDLDSSNGTTVNGKRIDRQALAPNDLIVIGETKLIFMQVPDTAPKSEE